MRLSQQQQSAATLALLLAAAALGAVALSGYKKGWATAKRSDFHQFGPFSPPVELRVSMGWWNATSSLKYEGSPGFELETEAAKGLGATTAVVLSASLLLSLYLVALLAAEHCYSPFIDSLRVAPGRKYMATVLAASLVGLLSVVLYAALAIGLDHEVNKRFEGQHLWARPDWAAAAGVAAAGCWAGLAAVSAEHSTYPQSYYTPLVV